MESQLSEAVECYHDGKRVTPRGLHAQQGLLDGTVGRCPARGRDLNRRKELPKADDMSNCKRPLSLRVFLDCSEAVCGERRPGRQSGGRLSSGQDRQCRGRTVLLLFPRAFPAPGRGSCLNCGVTKRKVKAGRVPRGGGNASSAPPVPRHSTRKRISTTSRMTKRTAMAHHWRRSLVM